MASLVEVISIMVILSSNTYIDAVKDFVALEILNQFDDFLFNHLYKTTLQKFLNAGEIEIDGITLTLSKLAKIEVSS